MKKTTPIQAPNSLKNYWTGILVALGTIAFVIVILVLVVVFVPPIPPAQVPTSLTPTQLPFVEPGVEATPVPVFTPPLVNTSGIVVLGAILILIVLIVILREVIRRRKLC